jgi:uncharacterized cupin superfamily protein
MYKRQIKPKDSKTEGLWLCTKGKSSRKTARYKDFGDVLKANQAERQQDRRILAMYKRQIKPKDSKTRGFWRCIKGKSSRKTAR